MSVQKQVILPKRLVLGDVVGVIAPASPPCMKKLERGVGFLQQLGLQVILGKHISKVHGYLAGTDEQRLADFHEMVANPKVKAIFLARGGYGTARFAEKIDYEFIQQHPKVIWGYSDMTYLHTAILQNSNLITFHGPMVASDLGKSCVNEQTKQMMNQLFAPMSLWYSEKLSPLRVLVHGTASGRLVGGNLTLLTSTLGTPFEIDTKDKLLLIEEVGEEPYKVDRMLNQLRLANKLADAAGVIVGDFSNCHAQVQPSFTLDEVWKQYFSRLTCPVITGFNIGHGSPNIAVPLGVKATINTSKKTLVVDSGVKI